MALDQKERNARYRQKHLFELKERKRKYYLENREKLAEKARIYRASLPRHISIDRRLKYREAHKEKARRRYQATRAFLPWLNAIRGAKQRAKREGIAFTLTRQWGESIWTGRCAITGIEFVLSTVRNPYLFSPSIDRIIPTLGYTPDNCRFVLHAVNALKGAGTDVDMYLIARAIVSNAPPES